MLVGSGGDFRPSNFSFTVGGTFTTQSGGLLRMTSAGDSLLVIGNASFTSGAQTGLLSAGVLRVRGNFVANCGTGTDFVSTGTRLVLDGPAAQTLATTCPGPTQHRLRDLEISNTGGVSLTSAVLVEGVATITNPVSLSGNALTVVGNFITTGGSAVNPTTVTLSAPAGTTLINGSFSPATLILNGAAPQTIKAGLAYQNVTVNSVTTLNAPTSMSGNLVLGAGGDFGLNRFAFTVGGTMNTQGGGVLRMTSPTDSLTVTGNVSFVSGLQNGLLTTGVIRARGNFVVNCGTGTDFVSTGTRLVLDGAGAQTLSTTCPGPANHRLRELEILNVGAGVILSTSALVEGAFTSFGKLTINPSLILDVNASVTLRSGGSTTNNGTFKMACGGTPNAPCVNNWPNVVGYAQEPGHAYTGNAVVQR
jgi:hypothetical protein